MKLYRATRLNTMILQNKHISKSLAFIVGFIVLAALMTMGVMSARGALTADQPAIVNQFRSAELLSTTTILAASVLNVNATTTNATSTNQTAYADVNYNNGMWDGSFDGRGLKHLDVYFTRGGVFGAATLGTSTFSLQGFDGENWQYVNRLLTATTSPTSAFGGGTGVFASDPNLANLPTIGDVNGSTVDATTTLHFIVDVTALNYQKYRCIGTRTTDGSNSCQLTGTF